MTRTTLPLHSADITEFTRALARQLGDASPSHLKLMNMVARAAGYENVQHMRARQAATRRLAQDRSPEEAFDARLVERTLHQFDDGGLLIRWPSKRRVQTLALWVLWARLSTGALTEGQVNEALARHHHFDDVATLRRTMIANGLLSRDTAGSCYQRVEQRPPPEALALLARLPFAKG
ncbi:MAG: DUF2087 domain-containing protein [Pseudomonadota bacterium]